MIIIVFGVTGCGKSTVGELLAKRLNLPFFDADDFHPDANVQKMSLGIPLTEEDRLPWLENLAGHIRKWDQEEGAVLACSALNEKYRKVLRAVPHINWVLLEGSKDLIRERLNLRTGHYMNPLLLDSQFETFEKPSFGQIVSINKEPRSIVNEILSNLKIVENQSEFGIIGMGVMGKSLALNLADHDVSLSIYNRHVTGSEEKIAQSIIEENSHLTNIQGFDHLKNFIGSLSLPRKILLMISAGKAVDLQMGDILIDGGNSFFKDTSRRALALEEKGILFLGTGVSGGEEGARKGPSIMPGGSGEGFRQTAVYFEMIAAKDKSGVPCAAYIGPGGAGHFIKMVHNSIEYAEMQVLAETYFLLRGYMQCDPFEIREIFTKWQREGMNSYLLTITIDILKATEGKDLLLDKILDQAAQKGTGGWSVNVALEYGIPYSVLTEAVMARSLSAHKEQRVYASEVYSHQVFTAIEDKKRLIQKLKNAYETCRIINHDVGFNLMREVSQRHGWNLDYSEIARIWTNGCIIRSEFMEDLVTLFKSNDRILTSPLLVDKLKKCQDDLSYVVGQGLQHGFALPVFSSAINYFLGSVTANSSANLIQAQRDYFGAHTYQRIDGPKDQHFHTNWKDALK
jgi:6-phosphogluconate dehydrogenase